MDEEITRREYDEYKAKIDAENQRQNKRIDILEESVKQTGQLTLSVQKLASNMESMLKEQEKQGQRLDSLESHDGDMWRKTVGYIICAVVGGLVGLAFSFFGA